MNALTAEQQAAFVAVSKELFPVFAGLVEDQAFFDKHAGRRRQAVSIQKPGRKRPGVTKGGALMDRTVSPFDRSSGR